jgi:hypothetical protein
MRAILRMPKRATDVIEHAHRALHEVRDGAIGVMLPLRLLLWACVGVVACDAVSGRPQQHLGVQRVVNGAVDQMWYVVFYFAFPAVVRGWREWWIRRRAVQEWMLVSHDDEWVIVDAPF